MSNDDAEFIGKVAFLGEIRSALVRVGSQGSRIDDVTERHVRYIDPHGVGHTIELAACERRLERLSRKVRYIGVREALEAPPRVHFFGDGVAVTFVFESREAIYADLLDPLRRIGLWTLDGC